MSAAPHDNQLDVRPFWTVQAVYDPDGKGGDFAYTIGLSERGLPELHLYGRPSLGQDPGADWKFSCRDCCGILNELGVMLVRGALHVGSTVRREYDAGLAVVNFRVDPPGDREQLEAFGVPPGADVLPVRWSLTRPPEGPTLALTAAAEQRALERYDELVSRLDARRALPPGWELPVEPSFDAGQRFGPMTPLVLARAGQMAQADERVLEDFLVLANAVDEEASLSWPTTRARAIGRPAGRTAALDALQSAVEQAVDAWARDPRLRRRWKKIVDSFDVPLPAGFPPVPRRSIEQNVRLTLLTGMGACLAGEVVADLADSELRLFAAGPWQSSFAPNGRPGPEWYAAAPVVDRVRHILARLTVPDLMAIATQHRRLAWADDRLSEPRYARLRIRLISWAAISAASCPPVLGLISDTSVAVPLAARTAACSGEARELLFALNEWLECLTCLLVHRARLSSEDVEVFAGAMGAVLPGLARWLNRPI